MPRIPKKIFLIVVLAVACLLAACTTTGSGKAEVLQASGTVETRTVVISSELGGEVSDLFVQEGDRVGAGDLLLSLDETLYQAQREQAAAGLRAAESQLAAAEAQVRVAQAGVAAAESSLEVAQAQLELARAGALFAVQANAQQAWSATVPGDFDRPGWYFDQAEQIAAAQDLVDQAAADVDEALGALETLLGSAGYGDVEQAEADLARARAAYVIADQLRRKPVSGEDAAALRSAQRTAFDQAEDDLAQAQDRMDELLGSEQAQTLLERRVDLALARGRYQVVLESYYALLTGEHSLDVQAAQAQVDGSSALVAQAKAAVEAAQAGVTQAERAVEQAQAGQDLLDSQIEKLTLRAPIEGVILTLSTTEGEMLLPGTPALTLGQLDQLKITVYIPEDRYGEVSIGDQAQVSADSFPDQNFSARVTRIADQAEYTPRNVQTKEERQTTVYAVELTLLEGLDQLKPGMPADVVFDLSSDGS